jgi:hypothetical protein
MVHQEGSFGQKARMVCMLEQLSFCIIYGVKLDCTGVCIWTYAGAENDHAHQQLNGTFAYCAIDAAIACTPGLSAS